MIKVAAKLLKDKIRKHEQLTRLIRQHTVFVILKVTSPTY